MLSCFLGSCLFCPFSSGQYSWLNLERRVLEHEYAQKVCRRVAKANNDGGDSVSMSTIVSDDHSYQPNRQHHASHPSTKPPSNVPTNPRTRIKSLKQKRMSKNGPSSSSSSTSMPAMLPNGIKLNSMQNKLKQKLNNNHLIGRFMNNAKSDSDLGHNLGESVDKQNDDDPLYDVIHEDEDHHAVASIPFNAHHHSSLRRPSSKSSSQIYDVRRSSYPNLMESSVDNFHDHRLSVNVKNASSDNVPGVIGFNGHASAFDDGQHCLDDIEDNMLNDDDEEEEDGEDNCLELYFLVK